MKPKVATLERAPKGMGPFDVVPELGSEDLRAARAGKLSFDDYVQRRVQAQIESMSTVLTALETEELAQILRISTAADPAIAHYYELMMRNVDAVEVDD